MTEEGALAVVCVSGGMDSAVTAAAAREAGHRLAFLHANYGQRTEGIKLRHMTRRRGGLHVVVREALAGSSVERPG